MAVLFLKLPIILNTSISSISICLKKISLKDNLLGVFVIGGSESILKLSTKISPTLIN